MLTDQERANGTWRPTIRMKGQPTTSKTFRTMTLTRQRASKTETAMRDGEHFAPSKLTIRQLIELCQKKHPELIRRHINANKRLLRKP